MSLPDNVYYPVFYFILINFKVIYGENKQSNRY